MILMHYLIDDKLHVQKWLRAISVSCVLCLAPAGGGAFAAPAEDDGRDRWWRGNLHTHTLWWGGDEYPEVIVDWYRDNGYHFLVLSDHNLLSTGHKWIDPSVHPHAERTGGMEGFERYRERFGDDWVETKRVHPERVRDNGVLREGPVPPEWRDYDGEKTMVVRLKPYDEFRRLFERPDEFMMMQGLEITEYVHMNVTNLVEFVEPHGGEDVREIIESNVGRVLDQREQTGQVMFPHLNHPNWRWRVTAEDFVAVRDLRFFEVYGGGRNSRHAGDDVHKSTDRMWDIVLTRRLVEYDYGLMYGLAVDDAHDYEHSTRRRLLPGRGWVMVRASHLTPEHIIGALESGDFYSSTGVFLRDLAVYDEGIVIEIEPEEGVSYITEFIGTRKGYDPSSEPIRDDDGSELLVTRRYSEDIGEVLKTVEGARAVYRFDGDELYVRARIVSSREKDDYSDTGEREKAWIQPVAVAAPDDGGR